MNPEDLPPIGWLMRFGYQGVEIVVDFALQQLYFHRAGDLALAMTAKELRQPSAENLRLYKVRLRRFLMPPDEEE